MPEPYSGSPVVGMPTTVRLFRRRQMDHDRRPADDGRCPLAVGLAVVVVHLEPFVGDVAADLLVVTKLSKEAGELHRLIAEFEAVHTTEVVHVDAGREVGLIPLDLGQRRLRAERH